MKTLLVPNATGLDGITERHVPLGLLYVATALKNRRLDAEILDINLFPPGYGVGDLIREILSRRPDVVGFSAMCDQYPRVISICRRLKESRPQIVTILGGPEATLTATSTIERFPQIDVVVAGECEYRIADVVDAIEHNRSLKSIPGLVYRKNGTIISTPPAPLVRDIENLSFPNYDLLSSVSLFWKEYNLPLPVEAGRGCPYGCCFCSLTTLRKRKFRLRSPSTILSMAKRLINQYGTGRIVFLHDNFTFSRQSTLAFCEALEREKMGISWQCSSRADSLDDELLKKMAETGCKQVYLGIETGSSRLQHIINKNLDLTKTLNTVTKVINSGIRFTASFITGFPEEKFEDLIETIRFMLELFRVSRNGPDRFQLHGLCPLHGSPLYEKYCDSLVLLDMGYSDLVLCDLSDENIELIREHPDIFSSFYHYPTPHLDIKILARVPYFMLNLLRMPYTALLLLVDNELNFPKLIIRDEFFLELVPGHSFHDIGTVDSIQQVSKILERILLKHGFENHIIYDVIKYDVTLRKLTHENTDTAIIESFSFDIKKWIENFEKLDFMKNPAPINKNSCDVLFSKENGRLITIVLPNGLV